MTPTLFLTRPKHQSRAFLNMCEHEAGRALPSIISPLIRIEAVGELPDFDKFATLIVTSSNAVRRISEDIAGRRVVTVGQATAELAHEFGADASCLGENVEDFLSHSDQLAGPVLYCRGVHGLGNLAKVLDTKGASIEEAVVYDQVEQPLSATALDLLNGSSKILAPVFSARTARLLSANGIQSNVTLIAISRNVAEAWEGLGSVLVAEAPTAKSMCAKVLEGF